MTSFWCESMPARGRRRPTPTGREHSIAAIYQKKMNFSGGLAGAAAGLELGRAEDVPGHGRRRPAGHHRPGGKPAHALAAVVHDEGACQSQVDAEPGRDLDHVVATLGE